MPSSPLGAAAALAWDRLVGMSRGRGLLQAAREDVYPISSKYFRN